MRSNFLETEVAACRNAIEPAVEVPAMETNPRSAFRFARRWVVGLAGWIGWLATWAVWASGACAQNQVVMVDAGQRFQRFEGWGVSLCWTGKALDTLPETARNECADRMFDPVKGLGFNIARYNIGGGEDPALHMLGYRESIAGYEPAAGRWDWSADEGQRWLLQAAKARGANLFEAFANSPPYWMTVSGSVTGSKVANANNLAPAHEQDFADYLVKVVDHFRVEWGIAFRTLEPLNEPGSGWWNYGKHQEGCRFDRPAQGEIIRAVARALEHEGSPTKISASDENSIDTAVATFASFDVGTQALISQVNTHSYSGSARARLASLVAAGSKTLWMSEYGDGDASGMKLARQVIDDLNGLHPAAWIYWQMLDTPKWGLIANAVDGHDLNFPLTKKFWVLANYTRFIRPGAVFVGIDDERSVAALDASGQRLTIVTVNNQDGQITVGYDLKKIRCSTSCIASWRTSATEDLVRRPDAPLEDGRFEAVLPGKSITTFVVDGLTP